MSWSPDVFIGELRPWPDTVRVVRGKTDETRNYVPESERDMWRDLVGEMVHPDVCDQLQAENAKLRELVRDMWSAYHDGATNKEFRALPDRMRELGVDDG